MASTIKINYVQDFNLCAREHFHIIKGISMVAALAAYICTKVLGIQGMQIFVQIAAATFLFCSGYGLSESFIRKNGLVHYWENKMIKVWLLSLLSLVVISVFDRGNAIAWVSQYPLGLKGNMLYLIFGGYVTFWTVFQFFNKASERMVFVSLVAVAAFFLLPDTWSVKMGVFSFPLGVVFSQLKWRRKIRNLTGKGKALLFAAIALAGAAAYVLSLWIAVPVLHDVLCALSCTAFGMLLLLGTYFAKAIPIFGIFVPFGMASYAIYLVYAEILVMLKGQTDWRAFAIVLLALCVVAAIMTAIRELLIAWNYKLRRRKKPRLKGTMW